MKKINYIQLVVWEGTIVGDKKKEFVQFMKKEFGSRVKYETEIVLPNRRNDLFFYIHTDDIPHFAVKRLAYGMRWWEDVCMNKQQYVYPLDFVRNHPTTW